MQTRQGFPDARDAHDFFSLRTGTVYVCNVVGFQYDANGDAPASYCQGCGAVLSWTPCDAGVPLDA